MMGKNNRILLGDYAGELRGYLGLGRANIAAFDYGQLLPWQREQPCALQGMWLILQQPQPDDYVLATGEAHSVREFVEMAFSRIGRRIVWRGTGVDEKGYDASSDQVLVEIDPRYFRPTEVDLLINDPAKARSKLGWRHKISFDALVSEMVDADLKLVQSEIASAKGAVQSIRTRMGDVSNRVQVRARLLISAS